jgi:predicted RecA/RadA family phage recombinase
MPYVREDAYFETVTTAITLPDTIIVKGSLVGITKFGYAQGDIALCYLDGEYRIAMTVSADITLGTPLYITSAGVITVTATSNTKIGTVSRAASNGDTEVYFFINR